MIADTPETFADATVALLKDESLRTKLGEQGRQLVLDRYDWRQIYKILDGVFHEAAEKRREAA